MPIYTMCVHAKMLLFLFWNPGAGFRSPLFFPKTITIPSDLKDLNYHDFLIIRE